VRRLNNLLRFVGGRSLDTLAKLNGIEIYQMNRASDCNIAI